MQMEKENFVCAMLIHMLNGYTKKKEDIKDKKELEATENSARHSRQDEQVLKK